VSNWSINKPEKILRLFLHQLREDISKFLFFGKLCGNDCNFENNWQEFCYQIQYGEDKMLDLILSGIKDHIYTSLNKISNREVILLFTQTDFFIYDDSNRLQQLSRDEMILCLIPKLLADIKDIALLEELPLKLNV
ncbi:hypothetical protein V7075_27230, partial [Neobacillus drentensis]|uniref:hypothetical protein n=1 Tax=Neobacillus drentensis TaxID=220684 RepID=UPI002FFD8038